MSCCSSITHPCARGALRVSCSGQGTVGLSQSFAVYPALSMRAAYAPPNRRWRMILNALVEKLKRRSKHDFKVATRVATTKRRWRAALPGLGRATIETLGLGAVGSAGQAGLERGDYPTPSKRLITAKLKSWGASLMLRITRCAILLLLGSLVRLSLPMSQPWAHRA